MNEKQMRYVANLIVQLAKIENKYNQLQSNWNSLREWIKADAKIELYGDKTGFRTFVDGQSLLDKMNELEGKENERI